MNLGFVLERLSTDGGTEKYTSDLATWLVGRGHRLTVYCRSAAGPAAELVDIRKLTGPMIVAERGVRLDAHDVVQGFGRSTRHHVFRAGGGVHLAWLRARDQALWRRIVGALSPRDWAERAIDRHALCSSRIVICNSAMAARQVSELHAIPPSRVRVVRNGVDPTRFHPDTARREHARARWGVPESGRVALFLGHGFRRKGLAVAGEAFARAAGPSDRFVVVGRDAHAERWLAPLRARLAERLVVAGPSARPEDELAGADATLLPTLYDAAANTTLEAMACGVPPVTSSADGNAEIVPDAGLIVRDPLDVDGFAGALVLAWEAGSRLGPACLASASEWTVGRNGEAMERIYRQIYRELCDGRA